MYSTKLQAGSVADYEKLFFQVNLQAATEQIHEIPSSDGRLDKDAFEPSTFHENFLSLPLH